MIRSSFCAVLLVCVVPLAVAEPPPLSLTHTIPLPGVEGRIDHFASDSLGQRLFVCALGNNSVEAINTRSGARLLSIRGLGSPQGAAYMPELDRLLVAADEGGICRIYDGKSFKELATIDLKDDADNVRYDEARKIFYVGFGRGGLALINPVDGKSIGSIKLAAHPEAFQLEKNGSRIFVNVPNAYHVAVIDRDKREVIATWGTDTASANFPMALDEANHRLFVGCRSPAKLIVLNTDSGDVVANIDISGDADDLFCDQKRHRVYAICGAGRIDVIEQADANTYKPMAKVATAEGARTGYFVPEQDTLFVGVPHRGAQSAEIRVYTINN